MEKRFVLFIVLTMFIVVGYNAVVVKFGPKRPGLDKQADKKQIAKEQIAGEPPAEDTAAGEKPPDGVGVAAGKADSQATQEPAATKDAEKAEARPAAQREVTHRLLTLGSYQSAAGNPLLITLNSLGATLERVELVGRTERGQLVYRDLDNTSGYLGNLSLTLASPSGCRVQVVPPGTPAAHATPSNPSFGEGLQIGDVILTVDEKKVANRVDFERALVETKPGDTVSLAVERQVDGKPQPIEFTAKLAVRPFELIRPEPLHQGEVRPHPLSLGLTLRAGSSQSKFIEAFSADDWEVGRVAEDGSAVEFRLAVDADRAVELGLGGPVEVFKRYRLGSSVGEGTGQAAAAYHLGFEIEIRNLGDQPQALAYRLDGTNGLPTEGWWYSAKINPAMFAGAGARDIVLDTMQGGSRLVGCPSLVSRAQKEERSPETALFGESEPSAARSIRYIGVDTQYFAAALLPAEKEPGAGGVFARAEAMVLGEVTKIPKGWERTANVTYQLTSEPITLEPAESHRQEFVLFTGPKEPDVLAAYRLNDLIYYGWFGAVSRLLSSILHFFHDQLVGNYAIAIIMLTVLVRGCMFPLSRKAAKNAAMMQELAPEMKKIAEKYKNNMEARGKAQQELFRKHNYNPLSGCWMMFLQLPVFIGLYRCLAVDIRLRQAPLFPGVEWASNLAGPDKLFYWKSSFFGFLTDESGWLGPYFNLLPIFTIGLFLVHQKLFTPPATDEQTALQMKMMKIMTIFMGVLFYKVPAGLCIYFIASSLWGIAERKLLPKSTVGGQLPPDQRGGGGGFSRFTNPFAPKPDGNGSTPRRRPSKRPKPKS